MYIKKWTLTPLLTLTSHEPLSLPAWTRLFIATDLGKRGTNGEVYAASACNNAWCVEVRTYSVEMSVLK
jgi:hypothetical protein